MSPIARGILVEPIDNLSNKILIPGKKYPKLTPVIIDRNIQSVK
jgi:hypothetical protein